MQKDQVSLLFRLVIFCRCVCLPKTPKSGIVSILMFKLESEDIIKDPDLIAHLWTEESS